MKTIEAKEFTSEIFELIKNSKSIQDINNIYESYEDLKKNKLDQEKYPKLTFSVNKEEIDQLLKNKIIDEKFNLVQLSDQDNKLDPLAKLLYSLIWKNGDLKKLKHIIIGIKNNSCDFAKNEKALVFKQLGKHLNNKNEPLIDQHVLRAYSVFIADKSNQMEIKRGLEIKTINKNHIDLIKSYKKWLNSDWISSEFRKVDLNLYNIDVLLYSLGKTLKILFKGENTK